MKDFYSAIADHAHAAPQEEVCGLLHFDNEGSLRVQRTRNIAEDTKKRFTIPDLDHLDAINSGTLAAYYHSHWDEDAEFTSEDTRRAQIARLPVFCYSTATKRFNLYRPEACIRPYEGRQFVLGFQDCAALVMDYYKKEFNYILPYFSRPPLMVLDGFANLRPYLLSNGFLPVTGPLENGDILCFAVASKNGLPNHVGVYDSGMLLHQLAGLASTRSPLTATWTDRLLFAMRLQR